MIYYNPTTQKALSESDILRMGLSLLDKHLLQQYNIYPLLERFEPYDADTEMLAPSAPVMGDQGAYIQVWRPVQLDVNIQAMHLLRVHAAKIEEIVSGATACAATLKSRYSELEVDSWQMQAAQAEKVLAGEELPADALIVVLAAANAVSVDVFARRVMANVTAAEQVTKAVVSQQQALELIVKSIMSDTALTDVAKIAELAAVEVVYDLGAGNG